MPSDKERLSFLSQYNVDKEANSPKRSWQLCFTLDLEEVPIPDQNIFPNNVSKIRMPLFSPRMGRHQDYDAREQPLDSLMCLEKSQLVCLKKITMHPFPVR